MTMSAAAAVEGSAAALSALTRSLTAWYSSKTDFISLLFMSSCFGLRPFRSLTLVEYVADLLGKRGLVRQQRIQFGGADSGAQGELCFTVQGLLVVLHFGHRHDRINHPERGRWRRRPDSGRSS